MKKIKKSFMMFATSIFLSSCFYQRFDNNLPHEIIDVQMSYENGKSNLVLSKDFNLNNYKIYNKNNLFKIENNFYVGDQLFVYYRNNTVDHVLVDTCEYLSIKLNHAVLPGSSLLDFFVNDSGININHTKIEYVVNKDGTYSELSTIRDDMTLFGVYREEDITTNLFGEPLIYLLAVYSYDINR